MSLNRGKSMEKSMEERIDRFVQKVFNMWETLKGEYGIKQSIPLVIAPDNEFGKYKAIMLNSLFNTDHFKPNEFENDDDSFATTTTYVGPDNNNICHVFCAGTIINSCIIFKIVNKHAEEEMIDFIEIILRHEIGHMISVAIIYEGITTDESNAVDAKVKMLENDMYSKMNNNGSYEEYVDLPMEAHANACANVDVKRLIELCYKFDQL